MKKIVCPHCGTINLEKFVTYPHCAGCSALLGAAVEPPRAVWWRRRVRAGWWAAVLGAAILALVALALSQTDVRQNGPLVVFPQVSREVQMGHALDCRLNFNALRDNGTSPQRLQNLRLRFGRQFEKQWQIISIAPKPDSDQITIAGRVVKYASWPIETVWSVQVRPRKIGERDLKIAIDAKDFLPTQYTTAIIVNKAAAVPPKTTKVGN